jgi:uncharacterized protein
MTMATNDALRQQLLKAGVVDKKQIDQASREQHAQRKQQRKKGKKAEAEIPESRRLAEQARSERQQREAALNAAREAERQQRDALAQTEDMLKQHALSMREGHCRFNFTHGALIRRVEVTEEQRIGLSKGVLAIVEHRQRFHLVPANLIACLRERQPDLFAFVANETASDEDAAYADYPVPDDLHW